MMDLYQNIYKPFILYMFYFELKNYENYQVYSNKEVAYKIVYEYALWNKVKELNLEYNSNEWILSWFT